MKTLLFECIMLRFRNSNMVDNIDVENPSNKGVEAFE
jgi:hypothetical protein